MSASPFHLQTDRLTLRLPGLEDIPEILRYFRENEAHLAPTSPLPPPHFFSESFWKERIPKHLEDFVTDKRLRLYLFEKTATPCLIGTLEFSQIVRGPFQACYLGYGLGKAYEGQGFMFEALQTAIDFAFNELRLHRIMANHLPENKRSARLLKKLGFQCEGLAKDYLQIQGVWRDHVLNSLTHPKWEN